MIRADDKVGHHRRAGDVDSGKAWRTVRRPSDMVSLSRPEHTWADLSRTNMPRRFRRYELRLALPRRMAKYLSRVSCMS